MVRDWRGAILLGRDFRRRGQSYEIRWLVYVARDERWAPASIVNKR